MQEDLNKWFKEKWVNIGKKVGGKHPPCGTSGEKSGYAKCVPAKKAQSMSKKEKESATRRKRAAQNDANRGGKDSKGQGKTPIYVSTKPKKESIVKEKWSEKYKKSIDCNNPKGFSQKAHCAGRKKRNEMTISEKLDLFLEKNCPTNPSKWSYYKGQAKKKFDVYPSAYANGWAARQYKEAGGSWKQCNESVDLTETTIQKSELKEFLKKLKEYKSELKEATCPCTLEGIYGESLVKVGKIMEGSSTKYMVYMKNESGEVTKINFGEKRNTISEVINLHKKNKVPFTESIFRMYSKNYFKVVNEARKLYTEGKLKNIHEWDKDIFESDFGKFGKYEGKNVPLDVPIMEAEYQGRDVDLNKPMRNSGGKKFKVYVKDPSSGNIRKVEFGAAGGGGSLAVKLKDPEAKASFAARHKCEQTKDKTTAGYWACRLPRYAKSLGLSGGGKWW